MRGRLRRRAHDPARELEESVARDAEESLVAALQESDTAVEAMQDDELDRAHRPWWHIGLAGVVLATLGIVVARRRR